MLGSLPFAEICKNLAIEKCSLQPARSRKISSRPEFSAMRITGLIANILEKVATVKQGAQGVLATVRACHPRLTDVCK